MRSHVLAGQIAVLSLLSAMAGRSQTTNYEFNDSHVHLTNNIQEGPTIRELLNMMDSRANRVAVFGIPLQQQWSYRVDGDRAPTYYLHSDAPLYYYSFTDAAIEAILRDPAFQHVNFDISWTEVAKYFLASPEATQSLAALMQRYPDRFLFGSDAVAPTNQTQFLQVFTQYDPLWKLLDAETSRKVRLGNYERIFDEARRRVRGWESAHPAS